MRSVASGSTLFLLWRDDMNYVFQCVKCDRPAMPASKKVGRTANGYMTIKKMMPKECECGGEIKPVIE